MEYALLQGTRANNKGKTRFLNFPQKKRILSILMHIVSTQLIKRLLIKMHDLLGEFLVGNGISLTRSLVPSPFLEKSQKSSSLT